VSPVPRTTYAAHSIPARVAAGAVFAAWVRLRNDGGWTWTRADGARPRVELAAFWDDILAATFSLPGEAVEPGAEVDLHFALRAPSEAGAHTLLLDLVEQGVTLFSRAGVLPLRVEVRVEASALAPSEWLQARAERASPWHDQPTRGVHRARDGRTFPLFARRAQGCRVWDLEGRAYVDYVMGWGSALLGYAHPRVQEALRGALDSAALLPFQHPAEIDVAERLQRLVPGVERVAFGKNGSDVCTLAARVARVFTGRRVILCSGYHGWQDFWAEQGGFARTGIPDRPQPLVRRFALGDRAAFDALYDAHAHDVAAVMLEPSGPVEGEQGPLPEADAAFLAHVAERARAAGALLVFDEILTGFRVPGHSVQAATGVVADLTCLGKALGGGLPLSALGGRAAVLEAAMDRTHYGPTYRGECYSLLAARAALDVYAAEPVAAHVTACGARLKAALERAAARHVVAARSVGPAFRFTLAFEDEHGAPPLARLRRTLFVQELLKAGVVTYKGFLLPSYAHDDEACELTEAAFDHALRAVASAPTRADLSAALEIPVLPG
jgi:glutamate-1-semialdehyde aminotransferase